MPSFDNLLKVKILSLFMTKNLVTHGSWKNLQFDISPILLE
jgi:hypothetical protein